MQSLLGFMIMFFLEKLTGFACIFNIENQVLKVFFNIDKSLWKAGARKK